MYKILYIIIALVTIEACSQHSYQSQFIDNLHLKDYKLLHKFNTKDSINLGDLYGKQINDSIYSDFLIIKKTGNNNLIIYSITKTDFHNTLGKENIPINRNDFYGYSILVLTRQGMDIEPRFKIKDSLLKGDPIDIVYDHAKNIFKVLLSP